jgi:hypothetical protein
MFIIIFLLNKLMNKSDNKYLGNARNIRFRKRR